MCDYFVVSNSFGFLFLDLSDPADQIESYPVLGTTPCTSSAELDEEVLEQQLNAFFLNMEKLVSEDPTEQLTAVLHYKSVLLVGELFFSSFLCVERLITDLLRIVVWYFSTGDIPNIEAMTNANVVVGLLRILRNPGGLLALQVEAVKLLPIIADSAFHAAHVGAVPLYVKLLLSSNDEVYSQAAQALGLYGGEDAPSRELRRLLDGLAKLLGLSAHDPSNYRVEVDEDGEEYESAISPYFFGVRPALVLLFCGPRVKVHAERAAVVVRLCEAVFPELPAVQPSLAPRTMSPPCKVSFIACFDFVFISLSKLFLLFLQCRRFLATSTAPPPRPRSLSIGLSLLRLPTAEKNLQILLSR